MPSRFFYCVKSLALLLLCTPAAARPVLPGFGACLLDGPTDIAVSEQGDLAYVADTGNHQIVVLGDAFSCDDFVAGSEGDGEGELSEPSGVVIDSEGRIIVADTGNNRIQRYDGIEGLATDEDIAFLDEIILSGVALSEPMGLGIDNDDRLYVADTGNGRVLRVAAGGGATTVIGTEDDADDELADGEMVLPVDVAVCDAGSPNPFAGHVYVADREADLVHIFDSGGAFVTRFGGAGDAMGQLVSPSSVAVDFQCNVYVADRGNNRVQMFAADGAVLEVLGAVQATEGVAVSSFAGQGGVVGGVFASATQSGSITRFDYINYDTDGNALIDNDDDGLPDIWEENGIDLTFDGDVEIALEGADPDRKTLFVEVDFTGGRVREDAALTPEPGDTAFDLVVTSFANAPVDNPDGSTGIDLILALDDDLPHDGQQVIFATEGIDVLGDFPDVDLFYDNIKRDSFGTAAERAAPNATDIVQAKRLAYRYGLVVDTLCGSATINPQGDPVCTGLSDRGGFGEIGGDDFVMRHRNSTGSDRDRQTKRQASVFIHELGHTLGLEHGGATGTNCKPNYLSVMNYSFVGWLPNEDPALPYEGRLDYSREALDPLDESDLDENAGIGLDPVGEDGALTDWTLFSSDGPTISAARGDLPIDWNGNGALEGSVPLNVNAFPNSDCDDGVGSDIDGFNDWPNLEYGFRASPNYAPGARARITDEEFTDADYDLVADFWENFRASRYTWSVKFICVPEVGPELDALSPGRYRTVVNIHNPHNEEVRFRKKAVIARVEGQERGPVSDLEDEVLGPDEALSITCPTIAARFDESQPIGDGFVVLKGNTLLDVAAVYTARDSVDVEYIVPHDAAEDEEEDPGDDPGDNPDRADLTIDLPERTRGSCPRGQGSCVHTIIVLTSNPSGVDVAGPIEVEVATDHGQSGSFVIPGLAAGDSDMRPIELGPGDSCYNPNCSVSAIVDPGDTIPEVDEANNKASRDDLG